MIISVITTMKPFTTALPAAALKQHIA